MAKVNFELVSARIEDQSFGGSHKRDWARCDLARPASELRAIAGVIDAVEWIEQAAEYDGALHIRLQHDVAWLAQERAFHGVLAIARRHVAEALEHLRTRAPEPTPEPVMTNSYVLHHKGAKASVAGGGASLLMPEGHYGAGFAVLEEDDGLVSGYFLTSSTYDDKTKPLAAALLWGLFPELRIEPWSRLRSWGEIDIGAAPAVVDALMRDNALRDHAAACYRMATRLMETVKREVAALQWNGKPSSFLDEDDDARDWLLEQMRNGAIIARERRQDADYDDVDGVCTFTLSDGTPLAHTIVTRLQNAKAILPEGYPFEHSRKPDEPLTPLVLNPKAGKEVFEPRRSCVPFQSFQSYCQHRRHDGNRECAHRSDGGETCSVNHCPLVTQVYAQDAGRYGTTFDEDPAFDYWNWERDTLAYAIHPNTERSYAWKAAGEQAVMAVVNMLVHDTYAMGIPRRLFGNENIRAVRQAIADGWLVIDEEMSNFGIVARLSDRTIAMVEKQKAETEAARREAATA